MRKKPTDIFHQTIRRSRAHDHLGHFNNCIAVREIDKLFPGSRKRTFAWRRAVALPETASVRRKPGSPLNIK